MAVGTECCKFCGKYVYFTYDGECPECGHTKLDPIDIFNEKAEQPSEQTADVQKSIPYPTAWMFIWSAFNPILQWILVGAYVANGETEYAWKLLIKPVIAQIIIAAIAFIIVFISVGGFVPPHFICEFLPNFNRKILHQIPLTNRKKHDIIIKLSDERTVQKTLR